MSGGKAVLPLLPQLEGIALRTDALLPDLFAAEDFRDVEVEECAFIGQDVSYTTGSGAEIARCSFKSCTFRGAQWRGASFVDVVFENCDFSNAKLSEAYMQRVQFLNCKLVGTDLIEARLRNVCMQGCMMRMVNLSGSKLHTVSLRDCDASEAGLQMLAEVKQVTLTSCDLVRAELMHTKLSGMDLTTCRIDGIAVTGAAELRGARVTPAQAVALSSLLGLIVEE